MKQDTYILIELMSWGISGDELPAGLQLTKALLKSSGWEIDKCIAFSARKCGADVGDIGPGWSRRDSLALLRY